MTDGYQWLIVGFKQPHQRLPQPDYSLSFARYKTRVRRYRTNVATDSCFITSLT